MGLLAGASFYLLTVSWGMGSGHGHDRRGLCLNCLLVVWRTRSDFIQEGEDCGGSAWRTRDNTSLPLLHAHDEGKTAGGTFGPLGVNSSQQAGFKICDTSGCDDPGAGLSSS